MKTKLGLIFGGMSTENEVSVMSANSILQNLNKDKYEIYPIYITKEGDWYKYKKLDNIEIDQNLSNTEKIENIIRYLQDLDVIFPVLHGAFGEDGTIQGLFEMTKKPYVGCGVLASSVGMDKVYTKIIFNRANINQARYIYLKNYKYKYIYVDEEFNEKDITLDEIADMVENKLGFPVFTKPSNSGSSVGINKAKNKEDLKEHIKYASQFDSKILIEEGINGQEVECAVLGNEKVVASCVGEIKPAEEFYSYDAKYEDENSKTLIPANLDEKVSEEIKKLAVKAFKAVQFNATDRARNIKNTNKYVSRKANQQYAKKG